MTPIRLDLRDTAEGGWDVTLARGEEEPVRGRLTAADVAALRLAVALLPDAGGDDAWSDAEERVARAFADLLGRSGAPGRAWLRAQGRADELGQPVVLGIIATPAIAELPWELLAASSTSGPLESSGGGLVVRLVPGPPAPRDRDDRPARCVVRHLGTTHGPDPVADAATAAAEARGVPWPLSGPTDERRVVTVVVHPSGRETLDALPERDPELLRTLGGADLAWIAVTGGDGAVPGAGLERLLIARRCPVVVTSDVPLTREAAGVFAAGLHTALLSGETVLAAVVAGRAFLREARRGEAAGRWWRVRVHVAHPSALARAPFAASPSPSGWPVPSSAAAALLRRAEACGRVDGFLGVEHLAEATLDLAPREVTTLLPTLRRLLPDWRRRVEGLEPQRHDDPRTRPTPRLARLARRLREDFGVVELWGAIIGEAWAWGRFLVAEAPEDAQAPGAVLEVLGGPEDGRRLALHPGEVLGRASGSRQCDVALYDGLAWTDPRLSRRHLRWLDVGWAQLLSPARAVHRADGVIALHEGPFELVAGDLVEVSTATWLVALPAEGAAP